MLSSRNGRSRQFTCFVCNTIKSQAFDIVFFSLSAQVSYLMGLNLSGIHSYLVITMGASQKYRVSLLMFWILKLHYK